jgi:hypothetical protein
VEYHDGTAAKGGVASAGDPLAAFCKIDGPQVLVAKHNTCELLLRRCTSYARIEVVCIIDAHIQSLNLLAQHIMLLVPRSVDFERELARRHYLLYDQVTVSESLQADSSDLGARRIAEVRRYAEDHTDCRVRLLNRQEPHLDPTHCHLPSFWP